MSFFENTRKPEGLAGKIMVFSMNVGHRALAQWGMRFLPETMNAAVLDCGCGGGANIRTLLKKYPDGSVKGVDYSPVSVEQSAKLNRAAVKEGRCEVLQASVTALPFENEQFDLVTAFETAYFWPDLLQSFLEVRRVLRPGGMVLICNECSGDTDKDEKWTQVVQGMRIYKDVQLREVLQQAGFCRVQIHKNEKGWLCVTAQK